MSANKLIETIPENLRKECPALVEAGSATGFAEAIAVNTVSHRVCRKNHNELVNLINSVQNQKTED